MKRRDIAKTGKAVLARYEHLRPRETRFLFSVAVVVAAALSAASSGRAGELKLSSPADGAIISWRAGDTIFIPMTVRFSGSCNSGPPDFASIFQTAGNSHPIWPGGYLVNPPPPTYSGSVDISSGSGTFTFSEAAYSDSVPGPLYWSGFFALVNCDGPLSSNSIDQHIVAPTSKPLAITNLDLRDIDNHPLRFLSVSDNYSTNEGPIFGGHTRISGAISFEGTPGAQLQDVRLRVLEGGTTVATATLSDEAESALIGQLFDGDGKLAYEAHEYLFELPQSEAANVNLTNDSTLSFRVEATSTSGETATLDGPTVDKLVRYTGNNRYGDRDLDQGGDDWVLPSVKGVLTRLQAGHCYGDISNMNGGPFPPHAGHQDGYDVDGAFGGPGSCHFNSRRAADARAIIDDLNGQDGPHIHRVFATYRPNHNDAFFMAIRAVHLHDGRWACRVIRPEVGHGTHFHWVINRGPGGGRGGPCPVLH